MFKFRTFRANKEKTLRITGTQGENKHAYGDPIFLLQFLNVLYVSDICANASLKKIWIVHHFQGKYLNVDECGTLKFSFYNGILS